MIFLHGKAALHSGAMVCYWGRMSDFWVWLGSGLVLSIAMGIGQHRQEVHGARWAAEDRLTLMDREAKARLWRVKRNAFLKRCWWRLTGRGATVHQFVDAGGENWRDDEAPRIGRIAVERSEVIPDRSR